MLILNSLSDTIARLHSGQVGVIPTDTVYGLVCVAANPSAISRLYELKHRENKPGIVIAADIDQLIELGVSRRYLKAVEQFWPNPISIELPIADDLVALHNGRGVAGFRIPSDEKLREFLLSSGPLLTTSANMPGEPPATDVADAVAYFGDKVDFYVTGDDLSGRPPSTVIRMVDDVVEVIREGAVKINEYGEIEP